MRGRPRVLAGGATAIRWDRVSRVALLFVLLVLVYLYAGPAHSYWDTVHQAKQRRSEVAELKRENAKLRARRDALRGPSALEREARRLGMVTPGRAPVRARSICPRARSPGRCGVPAATRRTTAAALAWVADVLRDRDPPVARGRAAARRGRAARSARPSSASPTPSTRELRRRLGGSFTTDELADLYDAGTDWTLDLAVNVAPGAPWAWDQRIVADAAFARYVREATDYAGGRRMPRY